MYHMEASQTKKPVLQSEFACATPRDQEKCVLKSAVHFKGIWFKDIHFQDISFKDILSYIAYCKLRYFVIYTMSTELVCARPPCCMFWYKYVNVYNK